MCRREGYSGKTVYRNKLEGDPGFGFSRFDPNPYSRLKSAFLFISIYQGPNGSVIIFFAASVLLNLINLDHFLLTNTMHFISEKVCLRFPKLHCHKILLTENVHLRCIHFCSFKKTGKKQTDTIKIS